MSNVTNKQDWYKLVCQAIDRILKQFIFNLYHQNTHIQIHDTLMHHLALVPGVRFANVSLFQKGNDIYVAVDFTDHSHNAYRHIKRIT